MAHTREQVVAVTVCELRDDAAGLERDWQRLVAHVRDEGSDLVLLPEMPFHPWLARTDHVDGGAWRAAVDAHDAWLPRLTALAPAAVVGTRPVVDGGRRYNEAFAWAAGSGIRALHRKVYLPDEEGFWEATWYDRGPGDFAVVDVEGVTVGFQVCTELWFFEHARAYGRAGAHIVLCPRATPAYSTDKWLIGGRAAAIVSGAYCLSSNRGGVDALGGEWAGCGWVIEPELGNLVGVTSRDEPFLTIEIDLAAADAAKGTYPRYVVE